MKSHVIGVDVGGTNIKLGLVNPAGQVISRTAFPTASFIAHRKHLINALVTAIEGLIAQSGLSKKDIAGIGIGLPGLIDYNNGIVRFLPNIPGWRDVPLKNILEKTTGLPVLIDNDVKLITLAEWKFGAGKGLGNVMCITLGTGVGSGLILNGQLYRGEGNAAGELGHVPLNEEGPACNCGGYGCLETYVGNRRLVARASQIMGRAVTLEEMNALAGQGNKKALGFWEETATHLGNALTGAVNLLNPRRIIIGGGVANNHKYLFKTMMAVIKKRAMTTQSSMVKIVRARFGNDAGIVGAQVLVLNAQKD